MIILPGYILIVTLIGGVRLYGFIVGSYQVLALVFVSGFLQGYRLDINYRRL